jgi:hypothetical protein
MQFVQRRITEFFRHYSATLRNGAKTQNVGRNERLNTFLNEYMRELIWNWNLIYKK